MFNFIKERLSKLYAAVTAPLHALFSRTTVDRETLHELEKILLQADVGALTTKEIMTELQAAASRGQLADGTALKELLFAKLFSLLNHTQYTPRDTGVYLLVGINGSGKTTCASKLAYHAQQQGKRVLLVAADTFRAAAREQLAQWAKQLNIPLVMGNQDEDPSAVVFKGCQEFKNGGYDIIIVDTAGRLQTKLHLMKELEKIRRVITKQLPETTVTTLVTVDSMLGQNSFDQVRLFHESTPLDGMIVTKMDGTGKGGIIFAVSKELALPVAYITFGEGVENIKPFDAKEYCHSLLEYK